MRYVAGQAIIEATKDTLDRVSLRLHTFYKFIRSMDILMWHLFDVIFKLSWMNVIKRNTVRLFNVKC